MIKVTKHFNWEMAHMLDKHPGLCKNLHGHSYNMDVTVEAETLNDVGMVIDFGDLKALVNKELVDKVDHAFMYNKNTTSEVERTIGESLLANDMKVFIVWTSPTAENMLNTFSSIITRELIKYNELHHTYITLASIKIWETSSSYAEEGIYD